MPKQFTHLLLTRFNVLVGYAPSAQRIETNWLNSRLVPFERYCLPSVAGQVGAEFRWLMFIDESSPAWFKEKISSFAPLVEPIYVDGPATDQVIARRVMETGFVSSPYLITTRLDSDDAISKDHLASVQDNFRQRDREFVIFSFGLQSYRGHLYNVCWHTNPFLSLIEKVGDNGEATTVFCVAHDRVREANKVRTVLRSPQWLQVLHDSNNESTLRGWPRLGSSNSHPRFNVSWPEREASDSVGNRVRFSAGAYRIRADRFMKKHRAP